MDLDHKWDWEERKLPCKVKTESGNPAADELRARLREIAQRLAVEQLKHDDIATSDSKKAAKSIKLDSDAAIEATLATSTYNAKVLIGHVTSHKLTQTQMNINKRFQRVPKSPPRKVMMDLQKERLVRTGTIPHYEDYNNKPEAKMMKRRQQNHQSRQSHNMQSMGGLGDESLDASLDSGQIRTAQAVFKPYSGDLFGSHGNNMGGMVYLSRMPNHAIPEPSSYPQDDQTANEALAKELEAKVTCASTICGWSKHAANVERLANEGALEAIIRLAKEDDRKIRRYCASAFRHMSGHKILCEQMIYNQAPIFVGELASSSHDKLISRDCAITMLNLTRMQGKEGKLVDDGAVLALMSLMTDSDELSGVCARGLFNLTCVDEPYQFIERVIKAFLGLASAATLEVKHICASALCNLSDLKSMRLRLVEEGVVQVLGQLARGAEAKTRRVCAIVLQSLASTKPCRQEMVAKTAVGTLYSLSNDNDANTLHYIASAMMRLALDPANCQKMVNESGVSALCNICMRCPDMPKTTQPCAAAFQILSRQEQAKIVMVNEQCVPALVTLLRASTDPNTLQFCLLAFCNLLTVEENHTPILQQGGVMSIIEQAKIEAEGIRESCALALFNLSCGESTRKAAVAAGAVPAIMNIAKLDDAEARTRCAATLCNFASERLNIGKMVEDGVISTFIDLLMTNEPDTVKHCCAALCQLAQDSASCKKIVELGAVPHIVAGVETGDDLTKYSCCSVLSALSFHVGCRQTLVSMGALTALISLAKMGDDPTSLRCSLAFANLSCEPTVQGTMIEQDVLPILTQLSDGYSISYSEENQQYIAKALCNLSCHVGFEKKMIEQDCVKSLMMIGMVRSVAPMTKQVCAKALQNLLSLDSQERLCEEGLVSTITSFSKLSDEPTMKTCAQIFNFLSTNEVGRSKLVEKKAALFACIGLLRSSSLATKIIVGKTVCNLLCHKDSQAATVEVGAVEKLEKIATLGDAESELNCAKSFFLICGSESNREVMTNVNAMKIILLLARSPNPETSAYAVKVIANLAQFEDTRLDLLDNNVIMALVALTENAGLSREQVTLIAYSFSNLSMVERFAGKLVQESVVAALLRIQNFLGDGSVAALIANTIRSMVGCQDTLEMMVEDGAIELLALLNKVVDSNWAESVFYDANFACFKFASYGDILRKELIARGALQIIGGGGSYQGSHEFAVASMFLLSLNTEYRVSVADGVSGSVLIKLAMEEPDTMMTQNASQALFMLSKSEKSRNLLVDAGLPAALVKLCRSDNEDIRGSASQALKNLSSEGGDGLEEGTVSALIAMSEGNSDNSVSNFDDGALVQPEQIAVDAGKFSLDEVHKPEVHMDEFAPLVVTVIKEMGGDAPSGKGPAAPPAPTMASQDVPHKPVVDEEVDQKNEDDENLSKVMLYAKMNVPQDLLNDDSILEEDEVGEGAGEPTQPVITEEKEIEKEIAVANKRMSQSGPGQRATVRSGKASPVSPPMPTRGDVLGPKEKQAKARRRRRSIQAKKKREAEEKKAEEGLSFDQQAANAGLF
ncbi:hypothetical protein TrST_g8590 [Triparma strigata]|uniref:Vacuolar protein 8 n=1 Tax=Triparma strigata TaxID=1606541 RepID=A0A9W6ZIE8_9STRA|nr:hypothetical protein TrST_g8590 [Triparma strigata]